uniref:DUF1534 domain-containing protein n=1 Tax=Ascaris lumbricoides TaxID=6252 RepID=A0A0M3I378_ASCLU
MPRCQHSTFEAPHSNVGPCLMQHRMPDASRASNGGLQNDELRSAAVRCGNAKRAARHMNGWASVSFQL